MKSRRPSLLSFILSSLTIVAVVLPAWLSIDQAWLHDITMSARNYLCLIASSAGSLLVIAWAAIILCKSMQNEERTETKFRTLLECAPDALIIMDRQGRIVLVNRRTEEMFGYERAQLLGKPADSLVRKQTRTIPADAQSSLSIGRRKKFATRLIVTEFAICFLANQARFCSAFRTQLRTPTCSADGSPV